MSVLGKCWRSTTRSLCADPLVGLMFELEGVCQEHKEWGKQHSSEAGTGLGPLFVLPSGQHSTRALLDTPGTSKGSSSTAVSDR